MATFTTYTIDLTPKSTHHYWRIELIAWYVKRGDKGLSPGGDLIDIGSSDVVRAEFSLALTCPQFAEIRQGRSIAKTWERCQEIFEYCGLCSEAPLFNQVAHQFLDERPETKDMLRRFLDEIEEQDVSPFRPSHLTVVRKLVTDPSVFRLRKQLVGKLDPLAQLNGVGHICGCNPYVPIYEIPVLHRSPLLCRYCKYDIPRVRTTNGSNLPGEGNTTNGAVRKPVRAYYPVDTSKTGNWKPRLKTELVAIFKFTWIDHHIIFKTDEAMIFSSTGDIKFRASRAGARFFKVELDGVRTQPPDYADLATWHRRLGHINLHDLRAGYRQFAYRGLRILKPENNESPPCRICQTIKLPGLPLRPVTKVETQLLDVVHADFCGPIPGRSKDTTVFLLTLTDDASGWMSIYFINHKTGILKFFKEYVTQVECQSRPKIRVLQSNDGLGNDFDEYLRVKGIERLKIPTDTQHIRGLLETTKCILMQSGLDDTFYCEALYTACYIRNRSSSIRLDGLTPYQKWYGRPPSLRHMHEFGAKVTCTATKDPTKGELETKEGQYLGFANKKKAYRIWVPDYQKIVLSHEVDFHEYITPREPTRAERQNSNAGGRVGRPSTSNPVRRVIPRRRKFLNKFSRYDSKHPDYSGAPQRYEGDFNNYFSSKCYHIPYSSEEDSDSDDYEEEIIYEENESDAS